MQGYLTKIGSPNVQIGPMSYAESKAHVAWFLSPGDYLFKEKGGAFFIPIHKDFPKEKDDDEIIVDIDIDGEDCPITVRSSELPPPPNTEPPQVA